jgi:sensor domain CHASE-containing protein
MMKTILAILLAPFFALAALFVGGISFILFWMGLFVVGVLLLAFLL